MPIYWYECKIFPSLITLKVLWGEPDAQSITSRYFSVKLGWVIDLSGTQSLKGARGGPGVPIVTLMFLLKEKTPKKNLTQPLGL